MEHATAHRLAQEIRQSEEYQTYHALKEEVMAGILRIITDAADIDMGMGQ